MWQEILIALSLVFIIEGIMPFLSPRLWCETLAQLVRLEARKVRMMGLASMLMGTALLYAVH